MIYPVHRPNRVSWSIVWEHCILVRRSNRVSWKAPRNPRRRRGGPRGSQVTTFELKTWQKDSIESPLNKWWTEYTGWCDSSEWAGRNRTSQKCHLSKRFFTQRFLATSTGRFEYQDSWHSYNWMSAYLHCYWIGSRMPEQLTRNPKLRFHQMTLSVLELLRQKQRTNRKTKSRRELSFLLTKQADKQQRAICLAFLHHAIYIKQNRERMTISRDSQNQYFCRQHQPQCHHQWHRQFHHHLRVTCWHHTSHQNQICHHHYHHHYHQ